MKSYKPEKNGDLEFSFPNQVTWEELDRQGVKLPKGMAFVDLVIERENEIILVEVKDPSNSLAPEDARKKYLKKLQDNSILTEELTPKARDSYTYIHLMMMDKKPVVYVVLLGLDAFDPKIQQGLLLNFKDRLYRDIRNECESPWKREHIKDCLVMSVDAWNKKFKDWTVKRLSQLTTDASTVKET